ncbi:uncharacterized protein P174DRAFT_415368 [Aspergillus novofumigatus IBT 16806]|uniref:Uncharacterized protein n=1 Tax=Aspergillus novofumigatus (strain IBT 16806) TaxID=1392255 RepID=A0A2I1BSK2_ASPN1|nr:uncharacterized protein P174DRAFT_415368 [Aspergillus novofumigatus IBT 16806]PKX88359.1 hypothetical protein P174DRAFT_415368 [Aspergillus novofumigatus IBT 16806]
MLYIEYTDDLSEYPCTDVTGYTYIVSISGGYNSKCKYLSSSWELAKEWLYSS